MPKIKRRKIVDIFVKQNGHIFGNVLPKIRDMLLREISKEEKEKCQEIQ